MIGVGLIFSLVLGLGADADSPSVWIAPVKGPLVRAGRDGDVQKTFDVYAKFEAIFSRSRQLAFDDGQALNWITPASGTEHVPRSGKSLIGWRDGEPILYDGTQATTPSGLRVSIPAQEDAKPVFVVLSDATGLVVTQSSSGDLRVALTGSYPIAADFGHWSLGQARMVTSTSGYLLLSGGGSAVVRIAKGRAEIVLIDPSRRLGIGLASDGRFYVTRAAHDDETEKDTTEVLEVGEDGKLTSFCSAAGSLDLIDLDRKLHMIYAVRQSAQGNAYVKINYASREETILSGQVLFVIPGFGGLGYFAAETGS